MNINAIKSCTDIPGCVLVEGLQRETQADNHLNALTAYVANALPSTTAEVKVEIQTYRPFQDDIAAINGIGLMGRRIIVP